MAVERSSSFIQVPVLSETSTRQSSYVDKVGCCFQNSDDHDHRSAMRFRFPVRSRPSLVLGGWGSCGLLGLLDRALNQPDPTRWIAGHYRRPLQLFSHRDAELPAPGGSPPTSSSCGGGVRLKSGLPPGRFRPSFVILRPPPPPPWGGGTGNGWAPCPGGGARLNPFALSAGHLLMGLNRRHLGG